MIEENKEKKNEVNQQKDVSFKPRNPFNNLGKIWKELGLAS